MGKINLPNNSVIDISVLQNLINVINAHDDILTALTNDFSNKAIDPASTPEETSGAFSLSTQNILHGSVKATSGKEKVITFDKSFSKVPTVVATAATSQSGAYATVYDLTVSGFKVKAFRTDNKSADVYIKWIAIGYK